MPAPPSSAQRAANQKAMNAAAARSGATQGTRALGGLLGGSARAGTGGSAGARASLQTQNMGQRGALTPSDSQLSRPLLGGGGQPSPLMQEAMRRNAAQIMAGQLSQYRSPPSVPGPGQRVTDVFGPSYAQDPSIAGRLTNRVAPGSRVTDVFGPSYPQDPSLAGRIQQPPQAGEVPLPRQNPLSDVSKFITGRPKLAGVDQDVISRLVSTQDAYGDPLAITSGYRSPTYNALVGGAKSSQHIGGNAIDVMGAPSRTDDLLRAAAGAGFTGLGAYGGGKIHADTGPLRAWGPNKSASSISRLPANVQTALNDSVSGQIPRAMPSPPQQGVAPIGQPSSVQMASAAPAPQGTLADTAKSMWQSYAPEGLQQAAAKAQEVLINTPAQKISEYGGFKRAGELAQLAVKINDFLPGGTGLQKAQQTARYDERRGADGDVLSNGRDRKKDEAAPVPPTGPVTPPVTPPPAQPMWSYPQYSQAWANLPTGVGGPIWRPSAPTGGIFDVTTDKKKKKA